MRARNPWPRPMLRRRKCIMPIHAAFTAVHHPLPRLCALTLLSLAIPSIFKRGFTPITVIRFRRRKGSFEERSPGSRRRFLPRGIETYIISLGYIVSRFL